MYRRLRAYHKLSGSGREKLQEPEKYVKEFDMSYRKCKDVSLYKEVNGDMFAFEMVERASNIPLLINLENVNMRQERITFLRRIHIQFGHMEMEKLAGILKNAEVLKNKDSAVPNQLRNSHRDWILSRGTDSISKATVLNIGDFNENMYIKLKVFGCVGEQSRGRALKLLRAKGNILHLIDAYSRYHRSFHMKDKMCESVVNAIMSEWISIFGAPKRFICNIGGEMTLLEMRDLCTHLNILISSTLTEIA